MSFFDSKEEVINIELTQYGKYLISKGLFDPQYYAFFDEDIIYDGKFMDIVENQNDIQGRVLDRTPYSKALHNFGKIDEESKEQSRLIISEDLKELKKLEEGIKKTSGTEFAPIFPLGTSDYNSEYYPAWNINAIKGNIANVIPYIQNTNNNIGSDQENYGFISPFLKIPQIEAVSGSYRVSAKTKTSDISREEDILLIVTVDEDNSVFLTGRKNGLVNIYDVIEKNVQDKKENFQIEVFVEDEKKNSNGVSKKFWNKLFFFKKPTNIKNNILLDEDIYSETRNALPDETNVEFYFDLLVDEEIDLPDSAKDTLRDALNGAGVDIYGSSINDGDKPFGEDC